MRIFLTVREPKSDDRRTRYRYELPELKTPLDEGSLIGIGFGRPEDEHGVSMYVYRCSLDMADRDFRVELQQVVIDPPDYWMPLTESMRAWRTDIDCSAEEFHENLLLGGWVKC